MSDSNSDCLELILLISTFHSWLRIAPGCNNFWKRQTSGRLLVTRPSEPRGQGGRGLCPHPLPNVGKNKIKIGILLPKLFWTTVRKNCSSDREKLLKFKAEGQEFANFLRSLEQFLNQNYFLTYSCRFLRSNILLRFRNMQEKLEKHYFTKNCSDLSLFE